MGGLQWHEVNKDERVVGRALGEVSPLLKSETRPELWMVSVCENEPGGLSEIVPSSAFTYLW